MADHSYSASLDQHTVSIGSRLWIGKIHKFVRRGENFYAKELLPRQITFDQAIRVSLYQTHCSALMAPVFLIKNFVVKTKKQRSMLLRRGLYPRYCWEKVVLITSEIRYSNEITLRIMNDATIDIEAAQRAISKQN